MAVAAPVRREEVRKRQTLLGTIKCQRPCQASEAVGVNYGMDSIHFSLVVIIDRMASGGKAGKQITSRVEACRDRTESAPGTKQVQALLDQACVSSGALQRSKSLFSMRTPARAYEFAESLLHLLHQATLAGTEVVIIFCPVRILKNYTVDVHGF